MATWNSIKTRREDVVSLSVRESSVASVKLGGATLWAADSAVLQEGLRTLETAVQQSASMQLSVIRSVLKKLVMENLGTADLDDKLFSAILGAVLRSGRMDSLLCASKNDKTYRVFVYWEQLDRWRRASETALALLKSQPVVRVRELEMRIFKHRAYNTWSSTSHVLAQLNYYGTVRLLDDGSACLQEFS